MFAQHCTACDRRQLIFPAQVTGILNTEDGIRVSYTCWCGAPQTWLTGKKVAESRQSAVVAA